MGLEQVTDNCSSNMTIKPGDLVMRKYEIKLSNIPRTGLVIDRDTNGYLVIMWGHNVEYMWDDYDVMRIE